MCRDHPSICGQHSPRRHARKKEMKQKVNNGRNGSRKARRKQQQQDWQQTQEHLSAGRSWSNKSDLILWCCKTKITLQTSPRWCSKKVIIQILQQLKKMSSERSRNLLWKSCILIISIKLWKKKLNSKKNFFESIWSFVYRQLWCPKNAGVSDGRRKFWLNMEKFFTERVTDVKWKNIIKQQKQ